MTDRSGSSADDEKKIEQKGEDYFEKVAELRVTIERNIEDFRFAYKNRGKIVYLFDTNIVRLFLNPTSKIRSLIIFSSQNAHHVAGTAVCTAEFLFSRHLAGQWGSPALISPSHAKEVQDWYEKIERELRRARAYHDENSSEEFERHARHLGEVVQKLRSIGQLTNENIESLVSEVSKFSNTFAFDAAMEGRMFLRLYDEDLIRPLALDPLASLEVLEPDQDATDFWFKRIWEKRSSQAKVKEAPEKHRENARHDAETIVQLLTLNRIAQEEVHPVRYVLVTTDWAVYLAYSEWFAQNHDRRGAFFALRRPSQYLPILNLKEMPNEIDSGDTIISLRHSLDSLLCNIKNADPDYPHSMPGYYASPLRALANEHQQPVDRQGVWATEYARRLFALKGGEKELDALKKEWVKAGRHALSLNASLLQRRYKDFGSLAELLQEAEDLRGKLKNYLDDTLSRLETSHMAATMRSNLVKRFQEERELPSRTEARPGSGLMLVQEPFKEFTNGEPLYSYLDGIARDPDVDRVVSVSDLVRRHRNDYLAMFFGACVAFRCAMWEAAYFYARRANEMLEHDRQQAEAQGRPIGRNFEDSYQEVRYFLALTSRHRITNTEFQDVRPKFEEACALLDGNIAYYRVIKGPMRLARALGEKASLYILAAFVLYLDAKNGRGSKWAEPNKLAEEAYELFRFCRTHVESLDESHPLYHLGIVQISGTLAGIVIYDLFCRNRFASPDIDDIRWASTELTRSLQRETSRVPPLYATAETTLRAVLLDNANERQALFEKGSLIITNFLNDSKNDPTPWDEELLPFLARKLQQPAPHLQRFDHVVS